MGIKGAKLTKDATAAEESLVNRLTVLGEVRSRKMFGGYGIFQNGRMFALLDSQGNIFFKTDQSSQTQYEKAGSTRHTRMPYHQVPEAVLKDDSKLAAWATQSMKLAHQP